MSLPSPARRARFALFAAGALAAALGCSGKEPPPAPAVTKPAPQAVTKAPEARPAADNAAKAAPPPYDPTGKRDPFEPFVKASAKGGPIDVAAVPPLQRYDLGEFKFVGVIWGLKTPRALIEDPEGKGYGVTVGTKIGRMGGTVLRISDTEMVVGEESRDAQGRRLVRQVTLKLHRSGGGL